MSSGPNPDGLDKGRHDYGDGQERIKSTRCGLEQPRSDTRDPLGKSDEQFIDRFAKNQIHSALVRDRLDKIDPEKQLKNAESLRNRQKRIAKSKRH